MKSPNKEQKAVKIKNIGKDDDSVAYNSGSPIMAITQIFKVRAGEQYVISGYYRVEGEALPSIEIAWGVNGRQKVEILRPIISPVSQSNDGWIYCQRLITVPNRKDSMFVHLMAHDAEKGKVYYDKISVQKIDFSVDF